jgi:lysophospholipase L1-like esterase
MKINFRRRLLLGILWLFFIFLLLQTAGYVLFNFTTVKSTGSYGYPAGLYVHHPALTFLYKPGFEGHFIGGSYGDIPFRINETGFRDDPFPIRSTNNRRVVFIGDSVVFGSGVQERDRFTELLQEDERVKNAQIEILNMGVNSYTFGHYLTLARIGFMGVEPDLVIVGFTLNDIRRMGGEAPLRRLGRIKGDMKGSKGTKWYSKPQWLSRMQEYLDRTYAGKLVEYVGDVMVMLGTSEEELKNYHTKWMRSVVANWKEASNREHLRGEIRAFREEMERRDIPFVFLLFPEFNDLRQPEEFSFPRESITGLLDELAIGYCSAYDAFAAHERIDSLFLPQDSVHYTPAGHRVIRDVLLDCPKAALIKL